MRPSEGQAVVEAVLRSPREMYLRPPSTDSPGGLKMEHASFARFSRAWSRPV
eukprot:CAMPEP_0119312906 /NCGR_PEP_ID=MMETSP1333-20130426/27201_1 /TAXON_ID=418940 /ORGANISM="Scyphosphaera apsteinii, Strain RCC1455" /LENGTH=51 /DNA_ID=CAMNT_0007317605 /DNA_START=1298 /DNA_END=1450 /DNA_ORIENTATION=-